MPTGLIFALIAIITPIAGMIVDNIRFNKRMRKLEAELSALTH
jgi:hypothetical protein